MADLDAKDNKKSKKNKGKNLTHRNFGAFLDIGKVKCPAPLPCLEMPAPRPYSLLVFLNFNVICQWSFQSCPVAVPNYWGWMFPTLLEWKFWCRSGLSWPFQGTWTWAKPAFAWFKWQICVTLWVHWACRLVTLMDIILQSSIILYNQVSIILNNLAIINHDYDFCTVPQIYCIWNMADLASMMRWVHGRKFLAWSWVHPLDKSHCESTSFWALRIPASKFLDATSVKELLPDVGLPAVENMNMHHEVLLPPAIYPIGRTCLR